MGESKLDHALAWAARGIPVFPLAPGSKLPLHKGWPEEATTDPERIRALWTDPVTGWTRDYNIGALTDGLVVVDIDAKDGKAGFESFKELDLPTDTLTVKTPTGGAHVYYRNPGEPVRNSAERIGAGLDVRGWHGYVVAPGSRVEAGEYIVARDRDLRLLPDVLVHALQTAAVRGGVSTGGADGARPPEPAELDKAPNVKRALDYLTDEAQVAIEGAGGDSTTYRVAASLRDYGISESLALELLLTRWNDRCLPPWDHEDLQRKVANAYRYATGTMGSMTAEAAVAGISREPEPRPAGRRQWFAHGDPHTTENWLYFETLPQVGVAVLTGQPQAGKTFVALELARSLATGKPFFGVKPDHLGGTLLLFAGTEGSGLGRRLDALEEPGRLPIEATQIGTLSAQTLVELIEDMAEKCVEMEMMHGVPVRLIVIETLAASGLLKDENDNSEASQAMGALAAMSARFHALVLVTHHPPKAGRGERGAGAIRGSADYVMEILRSEGEAVRTLDLVKARTAEQRVLGAFTLKEVIVGEDQQGRPVRSLVVSPSARGERKPDHPQYFETFMQCVDWAMADGTSYIDGTECVDADEVRAYFKERYKGRDRSNAVRTFKTTYSWAVQAGFIVERLAGGKTFLGRTTFD